MWWREGIMKRTITVLLISVVLFLGACSRTRRDGSDFHLASSSNPGTGGAATTANPAVMPVASYADIVAKVAPAVVTIHSQMRTRQPQQYPFMDDPFFRQFFGDRGQQQAPVQRREAL